MRGRARSGAARRGYAERVTLQVIAQDFIRLDAVDEVRPLIDELVRLTRREPLCISYDLFVDRQDAGHFVYIETWPDQDALDTHCASEHFRRLVPQIDAHRRQDGTALLMDRLA